MLVEGWEKFAGGGGMVKERDGSQDGRPVEKGGWVGKWISVWERE